jgi:GTP-binding protein Era
MPDAVPPDAVPPTADSPGAPDPVLPPGHRSGFVGIIGRPNVGKSTMLNAWLGRKVSIVSPKPQTTRTRILGVLTRPDAQVVFLDSPGWHQPKDPLGKYMMGSAKQVVEEADVLLTVIDATARLKEEDQWVFEHARRSRGKRLVAINKIDAVKKTAALPLIDHLRRLELFEAIVPVSATVGDNMDVLLTELIARLPEGPRWYELGKVTDQAEGDQVREVIREHILRATHQEVPQAVAVVLDEMAPNEKGLLTVRATILVEREGQKAILIGKGGQMLKKIGVEARRELEQQLGQHIFLELWVKVAEGWRKDPWRLRELGYGTEA